MLVGHVAYVTPQVAFERGQRLARNRPELLDPCPSPIDFVFASGHVTEVAAALLSIIELAQSKYGRSKMLVGEESKAAFKHAEQLIEYALCYVALAWIIWSNIAPTTLKNRLFIDEQKQFQAEPRVVDTGESLVADDVREASGGFMAEHE